ncbi:hypothetical protein [Corynebacterium renale]|uniref:Uncharacterized protein n=1 Tax=Corynebacterium renale TaxID=1724 RepID=A0A2A9DPN8_9CORY|nr:hypothetical protein [Corynebacterium renale]PFG28553.1 hypothetical protein ATK06_1665 [Corynebacterium renale]SQI26229.1 Uncharacterised protein [Corynebacterium renale]
MLSTIVLIPGSLTLVPELGAGDVAAAQLREAITSALPALGAVTTVVGSQDPRWYTGHAGSFRAWGADVQVSGGHYSAELVARYFLDGADIGVQASVDKLSAVSGKSALVVADGSAGMTQRAPLGPVAGAADADSAIRALLGSGVAPASPQWFHDRGVIEPQPFMELAEISGAWERRLVCADHTSGVGRYVSVWTRKDN